MIFKASGDGSCSCGRVHSMTTTFAIVEGGALKRVSEYIKESGISGYAVAIYDENTYAAAGELRPKADKEIILSPEGLHADEHGVASAKAGMPEKCDYLIAVGSGTVHDITRYIAHEMGVPFVSCPTAASVDGFCSSVAAMTWQGFKKTFTAVAPTLVVADTSVISKAPMRLTRAGFGDMIGKYIALSDWRIANILTGEYLCEEIYKLTLDATEAVLSSASGIVEGKMEAYEKLTYGLLMSGIAMQMLGNSRCASGAEHHISHLIEMRPEGLSLSSDALHGEKVGVGTLIASREYHRLMASGMLGTRDYEPASEDYIISAFGKVIGESVVKENEVDSCATITKEMLTAAKDKIKAVVDVIPTPEELIGVYNMLGVLSSLSDIDVSDDMVDALLEYSPLVRNRLTLMRLRRSTLGRR